MKLVAPLSRCICCLVALLQFSCSPEDSPTSSSPPPTPSNHSVKFYATSSYTSSGVAYGVGASVSSSTFSSSYSHTETIASGVNITLAASGVNIVTRTSTITASIYVDGVLWKTQSATSTTAGTVSVSGKL